MDISRSEKKLIGQALGRFCAIQKKHDTGWDWTSFDFPVTTCINSREDKAVIPGCILRVWNIPVVICVLAQSFVIGQYD